jgi:hypothetical protein
LGYFFPVSPLNFNDMKIFFSFLFTFFLFGMMKTEAQNTPLNPVIIDKMPQNIEEFVQLRDRIATTPQGGVAIFVIAMHLYTQDPKLGEACLTIAMDASRLKVGSSNRNYNNIPICRALISRALRPKMAMPYPKASSKSTAKQTLIVARKARAKSKFSPSAREQIRHVRCNYSATTKDFGKPPNGAAS